MATVEDALQSQVRNIEQRYGRSMDDWLELVQAAGLVGTVRSSPGSKPSTR